MDLRWYVARTKPLAEYAAADDLVHADLEVLAPRVRSHRPRPGRQDEPLFPGYLFVRCDLQEHWASIHRSPHIWGLLRFDREPCPVPDDVVAGVAERVDALNGSGGIWARFREGESVRVLSASTSALAQVVEAQKSAGARVRVLMEFMGRLVTAEVRPDKLRRVSVDDPLLLRQRRAARRTRGGGRWVQGFGPSVALAVPAAG